MGTLLQHLGRLPPRPSCRLRQGLLSTTLALPSVHTTVITINVTLLIPRLTSYSEWLQTADFYGYIIGAWAGCIVVPLDWQRKWQAWPIPNVIAGLLFQGLVIALGPCLYRLILKRQGLWTGPSARKVSPVRSVGSPKKTTVAAPSPRRATRSPSPTKKGAKSINLPRKGTFPPAHHCRQEDGNLDCPSRSRR